MCQCHIEVNEQLKKENTELTYNYMDERFRAFIETSKIDTKKRTKPVKLFAAFCPFCGKHYDA